MKKSEAKQSLIKKQLNDLKLGKDNGPGKLFQVLRRKINELEVAGGRMRIYKLPLFNLLHKMQFPKSKIENTFKKNFCRKAMSS